MSKSIIRQVLDLDNKTSAQLREIYNGIFDDKCTHNASKDQLRPKIAYRLQELTIGGLNDNIKSKLESISKGATVIGSSKHSNLLPGTKICREHDGIMHQVEVLRDGFEYNGQKFRSLSAIAKKITGTHWNGPAFFKVRN
ncbi:MAG: DUF2924 domain-containing protein [Proteobacteria bacterium]|nr:DUF2924 domain-containing protein [Pseudomonadota bacterium]